jgi:hypothetical protein
MPMSICALLVLAPAGRAWCEPMALVRDGGTEYRIYHAPDAPPSVGKAARDLAHYVQQATGATLTIANGLDAPAGPVISLGANALSARAGVTSDDLPAEAFRIVARDGNLYILGPDTPRGQVTAQGGTSNGTANGVYSFLEQQLDVRWLLPGEGGDDVPTRRDWSVPADLNLSQAPAFLNRRVPYMQNQLPEVRAWSERMKLGFSLRLNHGHNWAQTVPPELFEQHPDWFAMHNDQRVPPVGRYKLETTNAQLVDYYARQAAERLRQRPQDYTYSLSPTDSGGWSTSAESQRLVEADPDGQPSLTPLVLDFYLNVARRMQEIHPSGALAGYIYASYLYPPRQGVPRLPDNLYLVLAPSFNYGYRLYRPDVQQRLDQLLAAWSEASDRLGYYDLPNNLSQSVGAPEAPGLDILAFLMPRLAQAKMKSVYIYGHESWGTGALANYVLAKLMWNPSLNPHELADEFCRRAYGPSAGPVMRELYDLLDRITREHYLADAQASHTMTNGMLQLMYARHYARIEDLFLRAMAAAGDDRHRQRLEMFQKNLILLQWNLRHREMIAGDAPSPLRRSDEQVYAMLGDSANTLALGPGAMLQTPIVPTESLQASVLPAVSEGEPPRFLLRGPARLALYPLADEEIVITPHSVSNRGNLLRFTVIDSLGKQVTTGVLNNEQAVRFNGSERQLYFMDIQARAGSYGLSVRGAAWALQIPEVEHQARLHFLASIPPVYFQVDPGASQFTLTLSSAAPGETAAGEVVSPGGQVHARLDTSEAPAERRTIQVDQPGVWCFRPVTPAAGQVDDVYLALDESLGRWVSLDGRMPLVLRPLKP